MPPAAASKSNSISAAEAAKITAYLRKTLGNPRIQIDVPKRVGGAVSVMVGDEFIATLNRDDEDGEVSYALTMAILAEDL